MSLKLYVEKTIDEVEAFKKTSEGSQYIDWCDNYLKGLKELALLENDPKSFCKLYTELNYSKLDSGPLLSFGPNSKILGDAVIKLQARKNF